MIRKRDEWNRKHATSVGVLAIGLFANMTAPPIARAEVSDAVACIQAIAPMLQISLLSQGAVASTSEAAAWACNSSESELDNRVGLKLLEKFGFDASTADRLKQLACNSSNSSSTYSSSDLLLVSILSPAAAETLQVCTQLSQNYNVVFQTKALLGARAVSLDLRQGSFLPTTINVTDLRVTGPGDIVCSGPLWDAVRRKPNKPSRKFRIQPIFTNMVCERVNYDTSASGDAGELTHKGGAVVISTDAGSLIWQFDPLPAPNSANALADLAALRAVVDQILGTSSGPPSGVRSYDSGWILINSDTTYTLAHNLGTTKVVMMLYGSPSSDGSGPVSMTPLYQHFDAANAHRGINIVSLSSTQVAIRGKSYLLRSWNSSGSDSDALTSCYVRLVMIAAD